ncbi:MAG: hypothetical protein HGB05_22540 [Chloroflexi bacterium]|nr:hypothetical protein [Chloroflexota bacterium]
MPDNIELREIDEPLPSSSQAPSLYMTGMIIMGISVSLALIAAFVLAWTEKPIPDLFQVAVTICLTALAGMYGYRLGKQG